MIALRNARTSRALGVSGPVAMLLASLIYGEGRE